MTQSFAEKDPDVSAEYEFDFLDVLVREADRRDWLEAGELVRYPVDTGYLYLVTTAGRTGSAYPSALPRDIDAEHQDGSATLQCKHPTNAGGPTVATAVWTVPSGLTISSQRESGTSAFATLAGGTDGDDYAVLCRMTASNGQVFEQTAVLPVRSQ